MVGSPVSRVGEVSYLDLECEGLCTALRVEGDVAVLSPLVVHIPKAIDYSVGVEVAVRNAASADTRVNLVSIFRALVTARSAASA